MPDLKKKDNSFLNTPNPDSFVYSSLSDWLGPVDLGIMALSKLLHCRNSIQTAWDLRMKEYLALENWFRKSVFGLFSN